MAVIPVGDLIVMSTEVYDKLARVNRINQAIFVDEHKEECGENIDINLAMEELNKKYYG